MGFSEGEQRFWPVRPVGHTRTDRAILWSKAIAFPSPGGILVLSTTALSSAFTGGCVLSWGRDKGPPAPNGSSSLSSVGTRFTVTWPAQVGPQPSRDTSRLSYTFFTFCVSLPQSPGIPRTSVTIVQTSLNVIRGGYASRALSVRLSGFCGLNQVLEVF